MSERISTGRLVTGCHRHTVQLVGWKENPPGYW